MKAHKHALMHTPISGIGGIFLGGRTRSVQMEPADVQGFRVLGFRVLGFRV